MGKHRLGARELEERDIVVDLDEEVDVRRWPVRTAGDAAEHAWSARAVAAEDGDHLAALANEAPPEIRCRVEAKKARDFGLASSEGIGDLPLSQARPLPETRGIAQNLARTGVHLVGRVSVIP